MPTFDVVSKVNQAEVDNALNQTAKEIATRFDFRDTHTTVERTADGIVLVANSEGRLGAALDVLRGKLVRRSVSLKHVEAADPQPAGKLFRQVVTLKEGIDRDNARKVIDIVKDAKLKVQTSIHEDAVRVSAKSRDDLQAVIQLLRGQDLSFEMQFVNMRD